MSMTSRSIMISAYNRFLNNAERMILSKKQVKLEYKLEALDIAKNLAVKLYATKNEKTVHFLILSHKKTLQYLNNGSYFFELMRIVNTPLNPHKYESVI